MYYVFMCVYIYLALFVSTFSIILQLPYKLGNLHGFCLLLVITTIISTEMFPQKNTIIYSKKNYYNGIDFF